MSSMAIYKFRISPELTICVRALQVSAIWPEPLLILNEHIELNRLTHNFSLKFIYGNIELFNSCTKILQSRHHSHWPLNDEIYFLNAQYALYVMMMHKLPKPMPIRTHDKIACICCLLYMIISFNFPEKIWV